MSEVRNKLLDLEFLLLVMAMGFLGVITGQRVFTALVIIGFAFMWGVVMPRGRKKRPQHWSFLEENIEARWRARPKLMLVCRTGQTGVFLLMLWVILKYLDLNPWVVLAALVFGLGLMWCLGRVAFGKWISREPES